MPLSQGRIVWVTILDSHGGNAKSRPAVILTATGDIDATGDVQVAAITTLIGQAPFSETVELPSAAAGHPQTKLKKPCERRNSRSPARSSARGSSRYRRHKLATAAVTFRPMFSPRFLPKFGV